MPMPKKQSYRDRVSSTKLHLSILSMALITFGYAMTGWNEHALDGFVVGILGSAGIFTAGNVVSKIRARADAEAEPEDPPQS